MVDTAPAHPCSILQCQRGKGGGEFRWSTSPRGKFSLSDLGLSSDATSCGWRLQQHLERTSGNASRAAFQGIVTPLGADFFVNTTTPEDQASASFRRIGGGRLWWSCRLPDRVGYFGYRCRPGIHAEAPLGSEVPSHGRRMISSRRFYRVAGRTLSSARVCTWSPIMGARTGVQTNGSRPRGISPSRRITSPTFHPPALASARRRFVVSFCGAIIQHGTAPRSLSARPDRWHSTGTPHDDQ